MNETDYVLAYVDYLSHLNGKCARGKIQTKYLQLICLQFFLHVVFSCTMILLHSMVLCSYIILFPVAHVMLMIPFTDDNNTRVLFEKVLSSMPKDKARFVFRPTVYIIVIQYSLIIVDYFCLIC